MARSLISASDIAGCPRALWCEDGALARPARLAAPSESQIMASVRESEGCVPAQGMMRRINICLQQGAEREGSADSEQLARIVNAWVKVRRTLSICGR